MYNFYRWFPQGKIVFMAPTKPLVRSLNSFLDCGIVDNFNRWPNKWRHVIALSALQSVIRSSWQGLPYRKRSANVTGAKKEYSLSPHKSSRMTLIAANVMAPRSFLLFSMKHIVLKVSSIIVLWYSNSRKWTDISVWLRSQLPQVRLVRFYGSCEGIYLVNEESKCRTEDSCLMSSLRAQCWGNAKCDRQSSDLKDGVS